jgi:hypothetical protein
MLVNISRLREDYTRSTKVEIHDSDVDNADYILAMIAAPLLEKLRQNKKGSGSIDDIDVPEILRSTSAPEPIHDSDVDENHHLRWDYAINEMIFAMREIANQRNTMDVFFDHSKVDENSSFAEQIDAIICDRIGLDAYDQRIQKGCELFGKYFQSLWS